jgi:hypothetical protein
MTVPNESTDPRPPVTVADAIDAIAHFYADTPGEALLLLSMWRRRDELTTDKFAELVGVLYGDDETAPDLIALWDRRDWMTPVELDAIRVALQYDPKVRAGYVEGYVDAVQTATTLRGDDGGFSERYLERIRAARELRKDEDDAADLVEETARSWGYAPRDGGER